MRRLLLVCLPLASLPAPALAAPGARPVAVPPAGRLVDTSHPSRVVGRGTPASCTSAAVVAAVRANVCSNGGAIYNDGDGAIFFVSDDRTGTISISHSTLRRNPNDGFHTRGLPGIFFLGAHRPTLVQTTLR